MQLPLNCGYCQGKNRGRLTHLEFAAEDDAGGRLLYPARLPSTHVIAFLSHAECQGEGYAVELREVARDPNGWTKHLQAKTWARALNIEQLIRNAVERYAAARAAPQKETSTQEKGNRMNARMVPRAESGMSYGHETITPEVAARYLKESKFQNRKVKDQHVAQLAAAMRRGQWTIGPPLFFDDEGNLVDGQHRLLAVIKSGVTVTFAVNRGLPRGAVQHIDGGVPRSVNDLLAMRGYKNVARLGAVVRIVWAMEMGMKSPVDNPSNLSAPATRDDLLNRVIHDPLLEQISGELSGPKKELPRLIRSQGYAGWFLYCMNAGLTDRRALFDEFWAILSGASTAQAASDPAHVLRTRLTKPELKTQQTPSDVRLGLTVKAWNSFVLSERVEQLVFRSVGQKAEGFPKPILDRELPAAGYDNDTA